MVIKRLMLVVRTTKTSATSTGIKLFPSSVSCLMLNRIQSPGLWGHFGHLFENKGRI